MDEIVEELPLRYAGFSTNFRREAGAAGKDTRGMFRVHQFNKVEMFVVRHARPSRGPSSTGSSSLGGVLRELGLPYRVVNVAAGDLGAPAAKKYDCEAWFPSQGRYREVTWCSNTTDYQARRLRVRFRGEKGTELVHTLNGTAVTDRLRCSPSSRKPRATSRTCCSCVRRAHPHHPVAYNATPAGCRSGRTGRS